MSLAFIFIVTFLIQFIIGLETGFISPIVPYLSKYFDIKESSVIYLNTGFSFIGLLSPFFGIIADKYGKRKIILIALVLFLLGTIITGWAPSPLVFAFGRMVIGIGNITLTASLLSYISDFVPYSKRGRAAGVLRIAFAMAILISPMYSSLIVEYLNLNYLYWSVSLVTLVILLLSFKLPADDNVDEEDAKSLNFKEVINIMKNPITIEFLLVQFLIVISPIVMFNYLAIWLKETFLLSQGNIGYIFTLAALGTVLGVVLSTSFSDKIGKMRFAKIFFILMTFSLAPLPYLKSIYLVIVIAFIYSLGLDGGWSAFQTVCSEIYPRRRTVFMTLIHFVGSICSLTFTLIGPSLFDLGGYRLVIGIATISSILALMIFNHLSNSEEVQKKLEI